MVDLDDRFWSKVRTGEDCWLWTACTNQMGYGRFVIQRKWFVAHRLSYESVHGPIPDGLELDHLCRVRRCVRPEHMEAVTHAENVRRGNGGRKPATSCPRGHRYEGANVYVRPDGRGRGCRTCRKERG